MTPEQVVLLVLASVAAGAMNSVAGGGSFVTFPSLLLAGIAPIAANATNTVALWPGSVASAGAYRGQLAPQRARLLALGGVSLLGGLLGALLLLGTPERTFTQLIPWLLLGATLVFAFGGKLSRRLAQGGLGEGGSRRRLAGVACAQFAIAVYGGYFGGGIGILMLAALRVLGMENIHAMNGLKVVLGAAINGIAVVAFALAGVVAWGVALPMALGAILGGFGGAHYAQRVDPRHVRWIVLAVGASLSALFFLRIYLGVL